MIKKIGVASIVFIVIIAAASLTLPLVGASINFDTVFASDSAGNAQNTFAPGEDIYATITTDTGNGDNTVRVYIVTSVPSKSPPGDLIDVRGATGYRTETFSSSEKTKIAAWAGTIAPGTYYIVIDDNEDGKYNDGDVATPVTEGSLLVVPEYLLGGLAAMGACFAAFLLIKRPKLSLKH